MYLQYDHVEVSINGTSLPNDSPPLILSSLHGSLLSIPLFFEMMTSEDENEEVAESSHKEPRNNKKNNKKNKKKKFHGREEQHYMKIGYWNIRLIPYYPTKRLAKY